VVGERLIWWEKTWSCGGERNAGKGGDVRAGKGCTVR